MTCSRYHKEKTPKMRARRCKEISIGWAELQIWFHFSFLLINENSFLVNISLQIFPARINSDNQSYPSGTSATRTWSVIWRWKRCSWINERGFGYPFHMRVSSGSRLIIAVSWTSAGSETRDIYRRISCRFEELRLNTNSENPLNSVGIIWHSWYQWLF
jgi:hypothetical protein